MMNAMQACAPVAKSRGDALVVATGSTHHYFGNEGWAPLAPGLKTLDDATAIRRRILLAFERAEMACDPADARRLLTVVIVGGGAGGATLAPYHKWDEKLPADVKALVEENYRALSKGKQKQ